MARSLFSPMKCFVLFAVIALNVMLPYYSFCDENTKLSIVDSGVGKFAFYEEDKSKFNMFVTALKFTKYDLPYFAPDEDIVYYWYKPNKPQMFSQFVTVKVSLPDGSLLMNNSMNAITNGTVSNEAMYSISVIRLKDAIRNKKITPSQYGECKIELYLGGRLIDTKFFYLDTLSMLIEKAKANNASSGIINYLTDLEKYQGKDYRILEKGGEYKYIYEGFSKSRLLEELGSPCDVKKIKDKEIFSYKIDRTLFFIFKGVPMSGMNVGKILDNKQSSGSSRISFHIKDDVIMKLSP